MKKIFTLILASMLVFGFAGMAAAATCTNDSDVCDDCMQTCDAPGRIARGCEIIQGQNCDYFDYEDVYGYCSAKGENPNHQAAINICTCAELFGQTPKQGDTIDISMEILVDKGDGLGKVCGDNGVYWAEDLQTIGLTLIERTDSVCSPARPKYAQFGQTGQDNFKFLTASNTEGSPAEGSIECDSLTSTDRVVKIVYDGTLDNTGYEIQYDDARLERCWYAPDIPHLRADPYVVSADDKVYVRICFRLTDNEQAYVCPNECCMDIFIGTLCCGAGYDMIYPYVVELDMSGGWWFGLTISNVSQVPGHANMWLYENDGDVGKTTTALAVAGNDTEILNGSQLLGMMTKQKGSGTLGDAPGYIYVDPDFPATGVGMLGDATTGAKVHGYVAIKAFSTGLAIQGETESE